MAKGKDSRKNVKKEPTKTAKEKKAEKRAKKGKREQVLLLRTRLQENYILKRPSKYLSLY